MNLFVDSDGVFADFDSHVLSNFGKLPKDMSNPELWENVNNTPDFWDGVPLKEGAHELWELVSRFNPTVLTGCPRTGYDVAVVAKRKWWKHHFNWDNVTTCLSRDKATHMVAHGDILVDDFIANVKRWEKAGGQAVYYRDPVKSRNFLAQLLEKYETA